MFCYQCEQTDRSGAVVGCAGPLGNCGKDEVTADLQDLLIHAVKGIAQYAVQARALGAADDEAAHEQRRAALRLAVRRALVP